MTSLLAITGGLAAAATLDAASSTEGGSSTADPRKPPAISIEGVPAIPSAVFSAMTPYQHVRHGNFMGWAPDGEGLLLSTRFGNTAQLHRVYSPGGRREQITFFEEPVSGTFIPKDKTGALLLVMSRGGDENNQVHYLDRATGQATLLTDGTSRNSLGPFNPDATRCIIGSNKRNGKDTDLYLADPRKPGLLEVLLETKDEHWFTTDWSPDGSKLLLMRWVSINEQYPALFDLASKQLTLLPTPPRPEGATGPVAYEASALKFSRDGKSVYLATDSGGEFLQLAQLPLDKLEQGGAAYRWLSNDIPWSVESFAVSEAHDDYAFAVNEDGASALYVVKKGKRSKVELPVGILSGIEFSPDGRYVGFSLYRPDAPGDAYSYDMKTGKVERWTYSEVGGLPQAGFVTPKLVRYKSFDGLEVPAYVYTPQGARAAKPAPVFITIHGGPESQWRPYFFGIYQYLLRELGVAVIAPNVRGSDGYGKTYLTLDNQRLREDSVKDIGALLDWIATQPELDANRVVVNGGSYGGYMVLASLVHYSARLKAGIDVVGISSFVTFLENTKEYRVDLRRVEYGDERDPAMREFLHEISPLTNAHKIAAALMVGHGANDPRVPLGEAQQIAEAVRNNGQTVWTVYAANEGHGFSRKENNDYFNAAMVLFLREVLGLAK